MTLNSQLTLTLLGTPRVHLKGEPVVGFISDKARALLYYLALAPGEQQRTTLACLFWPEMPTDQALKNLRQALHNLQKLLRPHLRVTRHHVAVDPHLPLTVDLLTLRRLLAKESPAAHQEAVALARGELLAGFSLTDAPAFAAWLTEERAYLQQQLVDTVTALSYHYLQIGQWQDAIATLRQWRQWAPWSEEAGAWLMIAHVRTGNYNGALRTFRDLQAQMQQELAAPLRAATSALRKEILRARELDRAVLPNLSATLVGRAETVRTLRQLFAHHLFASMQATCAESTQMDADGAPQRWPPEQASARRGQLITITGLGGMGKTHVARAIAHEHKETFFDGLRWIALAPHQTLASALLAIAHAYQIDLRANRDLTTQIPHLLQTLESLLILDNGEHLPQDELRHFVRRLLASAPRLTILLTSRLPLGLPEERLLPLGGLPDLAASEQLFRQSATRLAPLSGTASERDAIQQICRLVDGMPLALQLAATLTDRHSCAAIAAKLHDNLDLLRSMQQDIPERQRSLSALLAATWAARSAAEQRALTKLLIFAGSFSRDAAREIAQLATAEIEHLCDLALLQRDGDRFTIHDLLRQYIQQVVPLANRPVSRQFQQYFLSLVADQAPILSSAKAATAIALLATDLENIQHAWRAATAAHATDLIAAAWQPLATFYRRRGPFAEGAQLLQQAADVFEEALPVEQASASPMLISLIGQLQIAAAHLHLLAGNFAVALTLANNTITHAVAHQCSATLVDARIHQSHALRALGRLPEAQTAIAAATDTIATVATDGLHQEGRTPADLLLAIALERGQLAIDCGNVTAAATALQEALHLARAQDNEMAECMAACELGYVTMALATYDEADAFLQRALAIAHKWADTRQECQVLARQARLYRESASPHQWLATIERTLALCRRIGDLVGEARALNELGIYYRQQGHFSRAQRCFLETLQLLKPTNDRPFETLVLQNLGALELSCGRYQLAESHLRQALLLCDELAGIDMQCVIRVYLSWHAGAVGHGRQALAYAEEALTLAKATARPAFPIFVYIALGSAYLALADWVAAQEAFRQAEEQHHAIGQTEPHYWALAGQAYTAWQLADRTTALALVTTVINAPWSAVVQQSGTPFDLYWYCYQILAAAGDDRASALLATVLQHFQAQLACIDDPLLRLSFAENVFAHRQFLAAAEEGGIPAVACG